MSLLDDRPQNPAKHFLKVKSGKVSYYDKESGENVEVPVPLEFVVLDQLATIKGWSDQDESGYWSNEVKSVGKDTLNVRTKAGLKASGIWRDIKGDVNIAGAKYHASIYVAAKGRDGYEIQNLSLTGAALNAWIEFTQKTNLKTNKVVLSGWSDAKKGSVSYKVPVFEAVPIEEGELEEAKERARELKAYHDEYFNYNPDAHNESQAHQKDVVITDIDEDEPINLDDIPF
jgi:hypothetical protein